MVRQDYEERFRFLPAVVIGVCGFHEFCLRFEVSMVVKTYVMTLWVKMPCSLVKSCPTFGGI